MSADEMKSDSSVKINWFKLDVPTLVLLASAVWWFSGDITKLKSDNDAFREQYSEMKNVPYRVDQLEAGLAETNRTVNHLKDTIISGQDLMRRDINRLTTQVEVLSSRFGMFVGEIDEPKQRRSRPGPVSPE